MWKTLKLIDVVNIEIGKTPSRNNPKYWDKNKKGSNVWLSIRDMSKINGLYIDDSREYISDEGAKLFIEVPKNTLIMSFKLSIGKLAITKINLRTNEAIAALKIKDATVISNKYLYYFLSSLNWDKLAGSDIKVKGKTLNKAKLKEILITLPSFSEQQRIVAKLDAAFAEIDNAIYVEEEKKNQIRPALKSIYRDILYNRQSSPNNKKSLLGDISRVVGGNGFPKSYQGRSNKEIPFIKVSDMNTQGNEKIIYKTAHSVDTNILKAIKAKAHEAGTLIFPKIGGAISTNKKRLLSKISAYDNNIVGIKPSDKLLPEYLHKIFKIIDIYELSNKASLPSINNPAIKSIELFVPNLQEQSKIIQKLNLVDEHFTNLSDSVASKIHNFKLLKSVMIKQNLSTEAA